MKSFTRQRVVKSYDVQVATPHLVDVQAEGFQFLMSHLTVITTEPDEVLNKEYVEGQLETLNVRSMGRGENEAESEVLAQTKDEANAQADKIIKDAAKQAEELIKNAETEAAKILQKAKDDEKKLRDEVLAAVREEVIPIVEKEGFERGFKQGEQCAKTIIEEAQATLILAKQVLKDEYVKVDEALLHFALKIAERLARIHIELKPNRLKDIINELTLLPQEREGWRLHVAPQDADWLSRSQIVDLPCPWVRDDALLPGECFLECQEGIFDARFQSQLAKMEQLLKEEFKREELGQLSPET